MSTLDAPAGFAPASVRDEEVLEALRGVMDMELGINIVDLGLVHGLDWDDATGALTVRMTLTSPECPDSENVALQTIEMLTGVVDEFRIEWVFQPLWSPARISPDGWDMLRALGFAV